MADKSAIEWTDATWNPIVGCSIVSPGCTNCYAMKMAARIQKMNRTGGSNSGYVNHYDGTTKSVNGSVVWTGKLAIAPRKIFELPLSRKKPTTFFVNSMGDLFHEDVQDEWIDAVFAVMALAPQHTFQILTKRAKRMRDYVTAMNAELSQAERMVNALGVSRTRLVAVDWPLPNVWLGVSAERQQEADERIPLLLQTPAAVRFISAEPLLGPIDLIGTFARFQDDPVAKRQCAVPLGRQLLDWVIVGGESGPKARPMHPEWARGLRDQCAAAGVPFFFKQWGSWQPRYYMSVPDASGHCEHLLDLNQTASQVILHASEPKQFPVNMIRMPKKEAGRELDGELHNAMPAVRS